jgi:hydrogenase maturation factor
MEAWRATTSGTMLVAVDSADTEAVLAALGDRETPVARVGRVEAGSGVTVHGADLGPPEGDSAWPVYERLLAAREGGAE